MPIGVAARRALVLPAYKQGLFALSGNEITDALRRAALQGDGLSPSEFSLGVWPAATNLCTNGGCETNTTGWSKVGTGTLARSTAQAKFGAASLLATCAADSTSLARFGITLTAAAHSLEAWLYIPSTWSGVQLSVRFNAFAGATGTLFADADMTKTDQWQRLQVPNVGIVAGDLAGFLLVNESDPAAAAGDFIYVDGAQCELGAVCTPYIETDGGTAARTAASVTAPARLLDINQSWVAVRLRPGFIGGLRDARIASWRDAGNGLEMYFEAAGDTVAMTAGAAYGADIASIAYGGGYAAGVPHTVIGYATRGFIGISLDGSVFTAGARTRNSKPAVTTFAIGDLQEGGGQILAGDLLGFATGLGSLTNADAAAIHHAFVNQRGYLKPRHLPGDCTMAWLPGGGVFLGR